MKMWSGRFRQPLDPDFERWQRSFAFDCRLLRYELAASGAHARALKTAEILTSDELIQILQALEEIGKHVTESAEFLQDSDAEDVHHFVEKRLAAAIGDAGYKLHSGRSRNEQIATDLRLYVRAAIDEMREQLAELCGAFVARAEACADAAMPAYTHLQKAEPVLIAHWLMAYVEMFLRDAARLADCRARLNVCPLGSGGVAGASLSVYRASMDEAVSLCASQNEGVITLPEPYSTGSSAMPQKKTPDLLELVRGKSGRVIGPAISLLITMKGLPLAYNKDLQETQEPLFEAVDTMFGVLPLITGWMKEMTFEFERMEKAAEAGFMNAWAAATYLTKKGVPSRFAHEHVGKAVQICIEKNCELQDLPLVELQAIDPAFGEDFYACLTLASVIAIHDVPGGTAPNRVRHAIAAAKKKIESLRKEVHAHA